MSKQPIRIRDHGISRDLIDDNAVDIVHKLTDAGFEAYLVGGCVRDLLCGMKPKDFDVATNATPAQVKDLFRRARLVGRRFPIAHVRYGRELIEVSTFRQQDSELRETDDQGLILRDHAFGDLADDAFRRDFTVNALYYDAHSNEIIDFVGGLEDMQHKRLRFIGDPAVRLAEDPVRYLRAIRFVAKLGFELDPAIRALAEDTAERLEAIPSARLFDEFLKLFLSGYGEAAWLALRDTALARSLFPSCNPASELVLNAMRNTDQRIAQEQPVTPGFLIAVVLWDDFEARCLESNPQFKPGPMHDIAADVLAVQQQHIAIPRRFSLFAREVWQMQSRLEARQPRFIKRMLGHKRFRAAFDFLSLRGLEDAKLAPIASWWEQIQEVDKEEQQRMIDALDKPARRGRNRRRNRNAAAQQN